jgi:hypothetical protein
MERFADCRSCGGRVALGRCLNCGVYPPARRWWAYPALAIVTLAVLASGLRGDPQPLAALARLFGSTP